MMKKLTTSFSKYRNVLKINNNNFLIENKEEILEQKSIVEAEKTLVIDELEKEEDKARSKMIAQLKEVFFDLPRL